MALNVSNFLTMINFQTDNGGMKKIYKLLSKLTNLICQFILIGGAIWLMQNYQSTLSGNKSFSKTSAPMMEMTSSAPEGGSTRMMKSAGSISGGALMDSAEAAEAQVQAKIVKTGRMSMTVSELQSAKSSVIALLPAFKAYVLNEEEGKNISDIHVSLTIKVPAQSFDELLKKVIELGFIVENKSVQLSDVTEQYIDLDARMKNKRILIEKYNLLLEKAQKISDTLEINRQLEATSSELESLTGQMKYLNNQIDLSSLDIYLVQKLAPTEQNTESFFSETGTNLNAGLSYFRSTFLFIISLWPFYLVAALGYFIYRKFRKS